MNIHTNTLFFAPYYTYLYNNNLFSKNITVTTHIGMESCYFHLMDKIKIKFEKRQEKLLLFHCLYYKNNAVMFDKSMLIISNKYAKNVINIQYSILL